MRSVSKRRYQKESKENERCEGKIVGKELIGDESLFTCKAFSFFARAASIGGFISMFT